MGGSAVLLGKLLIGLLCVPVVLFLASRRRLDELPARRFDQLATLGCAASRLGAFVAVYLVLRQEVPSDVPAWYYPQARQALSGAVPYRDIASSYAPLFHHLLAIPAALWASPKSLVLFAILAEIASIPLWMRVARGWLDERTARLAAILYVASPIAIINVALNGQNQVLSALALAASLALVQAGRPIASGLALGAAVTAVKFLSALFAPLPWIAAGGRAGGRARWTVGFAALPLVVYGALIAARIDVLQPLRREASQRTSGNLMFLLSALGLGPPAGVWTVIVAATLFLLLAAIFLWAWRSGAVGPGGGALELASLILCVVLLVSLKSYAGYINLALFPLCAVAASGAGRRAIVAFGAFGSVAVIEPALWFRWLANTDLRGLLAASSEVPRWRLGVFLVLEIALLASYVALAWKAFTLLRERALDADRAQRAAPGTH